MAEIKSTNQRVMQTKRLVKEALLQMLRTQNINKISIRELCQIAGINRTTFYNHYGSQYDVINEIAAEFLQETSYSVMRDLANGRSMKESLADVLGCIKNNKEFANLILQQDNYDIISSIKVTMPQFDQIFIERMPDTMSLEQKQAVATFVQYGSLKLIEEWVRTDCSRSPKEEVELLLFVIDR